MKLFCCYAVALIIHRQLLDAALLPNGNKASKTSVSMATWKRFLTSFQMDENKKVEVVIGQLSFAFR